MFDLKNLVFITSLLVGAGSASLTTATVGGVVAYQATQPTSETEMKDIDFDSPIILPEENIDNDRSENDRKRVRRKKVKKSKKAKRNHKKRKGKAHKGGGKKRHKGKKGKDKKGRKKRKSRSRGGLSSALGMASRYIPLPF